jgi:hypothetical protein
MTAMTPEQRRERNRLRSLRWRRAHGIGPRKPAQRPWLALGISRSTPPLAPTGEGPPGGSPGAGNGRTRGGARPLAMAACGAAREPRQDRCGERSYGGGAQLSEMTKEQLL